MDDQCKLDKGQVVMDYNCLLNFVDKKSDKFYRIQVLENTKGFYAWTRWGRNGTVGQNKLEGPISQADAVKRFKKKFEEKTKNKWDARQNFTPVEGKYTLVVEKSGSSNSNKDTKSQSPQKAEFADVLHEIKLPVDVLNVIFLYLPLRDVLRYMQVCKAWKTMLSEKHFWKTYIQTKFDLGLKSDLSDEGPIAEWSGAPWYRNRENDSEEREGERTWFCYFDRDGMNDIYVMRPFPSMWNCRVVHPYGLDPFSGDVRSLQGFCRALEILTYMRNESSRLGMASGNECSSNEGHNEISVVLFPWEKKKLPTPLELLNGVFHFHPEIYEEYAKNPKDKGNIAKKKLDFHVRPNEYAMGDDEEYDEDINEHDIVEKPCLNTIFGMDYPSEDEQWKYEDSQKFYEWLQPIMYPSVTMFVGDDKFNPVAIFLLTQLAPGWVGGALTAATWT